MSVELTIAIGGLVICLLGQTAAVAWMIGRVSERVDHHAEWIDEHKGLAVAIAGIEKILESQEARLGRLEGGS